MLSGLPRWQVMKRSVRSDPPVCFCCAKKLRLNTVILVCSHDDHGISPGRGCDNLRCTKCDFEVLRISDRRWKDDVEYLFFRNFYPNLEKLQPKLLKSPGASPDTPRKLVCWHCQVSGSNIYQMRVLRCCSRANMRLGSRSRAFEHPR